MNAHELIHTAIYSGLFLCLFAIGEFLYHKLKLPVEVTRKFVHVFTGFICLTFPFYLGSHWSVLILTISFLLLLIISMKFNFLKSINAVDRKTGGSFLFPIVIYITYWAYSIFGLGYSTGTDLPIQEHFSLEGILSNPFTVFYYLPILILSICDPLAALIGRNWPKGKYHILGHQKTLSGSFAFFISAFLLSFIFSISLSPTASMGVLIALTIAFVSTIAEGISQKGIDNVLIPVSVISTLVFYNNYIL